MNVIYNAIDAIGIPSIGLAIILFTLVIYLCLLPLTIKQQKFSKLSAKMNPEIQAIQAKYKGKKDNESVLRMNEETKAVYAKYGTSPMGSCLQLAIQMPILFALYRVIDNVPAYVTKVKDAFLPFVSEFINVKGSTDFIQNTDNFAAASRFSKQFSNELFLSGDKEYLTNTFIDVLNKATTSEWNNIFASGNYPDLKGLITNVSHTGALDMVEKYNSFLGINIANSPSYLFKEGISSHAFGLVIGAILIPLLSALTQWLNTKLMPQPDTTGGNSTADSVAASMKSMNIMMPIMSAFFCFTLPVGMGIYWIAGAVIRSIQQIAINKYIDKLDFDKVIEKNIEKSKDKQAKTHNKTSAIINSSKISTKTIVTDSNLNDEKLKKASELSKNADKNSITAKANMVKNFNDKK